MRRTTVFALLLIHLNFTAFIPQVDEVDRFDQNGKQIDDINSLSEFLYEVVLGNKDSTPEDEDNDNDLYYHVIKFDHLFCQYGVPVNLREIGFYVSHRNAFFKQDKFPLVVFEIPSPPPRSLA